MKLAMHDPKFEQEVQRKMQELEFVPSESVWAGIRQGIAPRERRRAVAIFWWLFPGMLLLAGAVVMYRHSAFPGVITAVKPVHGGSKAEGGSAGSGSAKIGRAGAVQGTGGGCGEGGTGGAGNGVEGGVLVAAAGSGGASVAAMLR